MSMFTSLRSDSVSPIPLHSSSSATLVASSVPDTLSETLKVASQYPSGSEAPLPPHSIQALIEAVHKLGERVVAIEADNRILKQRVRELESKLSRKGTNH